MKPRTPDRFERIVLKAIRQHGVRLGPDDVTISLTGPDVVTLLRREHAWMRGTVQREPDLPGQMPDEMWVAIRSDKRVMEQALRVVVRETKRNILNALNQRRK